jgi:hypothetical protein
MSYLVARHGRCCTPMRAAEMHCRRSCVAASGQNPSASEAWGTALTISTPALADGGTAFASLSDRSITVHALTTVVHHEDLDLQARVVEGYG